MRRFVERQNIQHYRRQLATEADKAKRKTLMELLAEEEAKPADPADVENPEDVKPRFAFWRPVGSGKSSRH